VQTLAHMDFEMNILRSLNLNVGDKLIIYCYAFLWEKEMEKTFGLGLGLEFEQCQITYDNGFAKCLRYFKLDSNTDSYKRKKLVFS
jgi:hypothetical protein